jgi:dTDP-glucose 4,6-dehydratase
MAGFVGSHLLEHLLENTDWDIVGLVTFRHRGDSLRLDLDKYDPARVTVLYHDLRGPISPRLVSQIGLIDYIINAAAESHVDRSIEDPVPFIEANVSIVCNMLEYARVAKPEKFVQISTDEVFGPAPVGHDHAEWSTTLPSNPYSASKACQEAIAISYFRTYGVPLIITNCMNQVGERQDTEKYVPSVIGKVLRGETVEVHGDLEAGTVGSRHYIHARSHADAVLFLLNNHTPQSYPEFDRPSRFNIVGEKELDNLEMAQLLAGMVGKPLHHEIVGFHQRRPGHDLRYSLDGTKLAEAGWSPPMTLETSLAKTVGWTLENREWL